MSKCIKILKYILFAFNLLFWATGCAIIAIGIYFVVHNVYGDLFPNSPSITVGNILILFGCIIMVFGFLGCMGAIKENKCLLLTIDPYVTQQLRISFDKHKQKNNNMTVWDDIQRNFKCCGINGSSDWDKEIPKSCCEEGVCNKKNAFTGCSVFFRTWFENNFLYVGITTICISVIEVLGMSFALTLYCHISRSSGSFIK
ncbi:leukocyte surface antigen CD53 isoform 2-T3 [Leptodactylus fuscus]|uniref:leukocyte surface antigen CD53 isoform X2 n=1 Tax=Leptodactylus fuscus TaxID=238119 RepID=UPI003F4E7E0E